jgi:hypothetical protein
LKTLKILFITLSFLTGLSHARQASKNEKYIILVSVKYKGSTKRDHYKHETNKLSWKAGGKSRLKKIIKETFGTDKISTKIVRPYKGFIFYQEKKKGKTNHFTSTYYETLENAKKAAKSKTKSGYTVLEVGYNNGKLLDEVLSDHQKELKRLLSIFNETLKCEDENFALEELRPGIYRFKKGNTIVTVNGRKFITQGGDRKKINKDFLTGMVNAYGNVCPKVAGVSPKTTMENLEKHFIKHREKQHRECLLNSKKKSDCKKYKDNPIYAGAPRA